MGNNNGKVIKQLEEQNRENRSQLEQLKNSQALADQKYENEKSKMGIQVAALKTQYDSTLNNEKERRRDIEARLDMAHKQERMLTEQIQETRAETANMIQQLNDANQRSLNAIMENHTERVNQIQEGHNQRVQELTQANNEQIKHLFTEMNKRYEQQSTDHKITLQNFMEMAQAEAQQRQEMNNQQLDFLRNSLDDANRRMEAVLERQTLMMQQFMKEQNEFRAYLEHKPEMPLQKPEGLEETKIRARNQHNIDVTNFYNFAFAGHTKAGKSSIINAIRGILSDRSLKKRAEDPKLPAPIDFTECTGDVSFYTFPEEKLAYVRLYDVPGSGTLSHNSETYFDDKGLCAFDCLIILTQSTLCQEDVNFATCALKYHQPVAFVRSKCDLDLINKFVEQGDDMITASQKINQDEINEYIVKMQHAFANEIQQRAPHLSKIPCFFIAAPALYKAVRGEANMFYQEAALLNYIKLMSMYQHNIIKTN